MLEVRHGDRELIRKAVELDDTNRTVRSRDISRPLSDVPDWNFWAANETEIVVGSGYATLNLEVSSRGDIWYIYGNVLDSGAGILADVDITIVRKEDDETIATVTTDESGDYVVWYLPKGVYTVTPSKTNYNFIAVDVTLGGTEEEEQDFVGTREYGFVARRLITTNQEKVSVELSDFAVYIYIDDLDKSHLRSDGQDIAIFLADDTTRLPLEIEKYDDSGATGILHAWVKVPTLAADADLVLYMYYNDPNYIQPARDSEFGSENVWDSYYLAVWHMNDDPDSTHIKDSTSYARVGTKIGTVAQATGKIGYGQNISSRNAGNNITVPHHASLMSSEKTISGWLKPTYDGSHVSKGTYGSSSFWLGLRNEVLRFMGIDADGVSIEFYGETDVKVAGTYFYCQAVYGHDGEDYVHKLYVNKNDEAFASETTIDSGYLRLTDSDEVLYFGYLSSGYLDEIRISSVKRSKAQHDTEYDNQNSPATFLTIGDETDDGKDEA